MIALNILLVLCKIMIGLMLVLCILPVLILGALIPPLRKPSDYFIGEFLPNFFR